MLVLKKISSRFTLMTLLDLWHVGALKDFDTGSVTTYVYVLRKTCLPRNPPQTETKFKLHQAFNSAGTLFWEPLVACTGQPKAMLLLLCRIIEDPICRMSE